MASHLELHDDVPPPPYTETDILSSSGGPRSPLSPSHRRDSQGDDAATHSTSSTNGDIIYTPPLTPQSAHQSNFGGDADHLSVSSAFAYFYTRSAPASLVMLPRLQHTITVRHDSTPDSLPYPGHLATRDVRLEDWQTFVNYLIPHFSAASNEQVIDRKLRAEGISAGGNTNNKNNNDDTRSQTSGRIHAEAQLDRIRVQSPVDAAQRRQSVVRTIAEWNTGFFMPRAVVVSLEEEPNVQIPGAWDQSFDAQQPERLDSAAAGPSRSRFGRFNPFGNGGGDGRGSGFRFGGIAIDGDRVSIGDNIIADRNGVRIGSVVADTSGISVNGQPMFGGGMPSGPRGFPVAGGPCGGRFPGSPGFPSMGPPLGGSFSPWGGRGNGPWGRGACRGGARRWGGHPEHDGTADESHQRGPGRGRGRRRHIDNDHRRSRSSSVSSASSVSSLSSSGSSLSSVLDPDDLRESQLTIAKQHLQEWLSHPDQPVTKQKVKELKQQVKQAKNLPSNQANGINETANIAFDRGAMRGKVKSLIKQWKALEKQQKRQRRQLRREQKRKNREEKRERRNTRREMRRAERDHRRRHGLGSPPGPNLPHMPPVPPVSIVPPMPPIFSVPSCGSAPPIPPAPFSPHLGMFIDGPGNSPRGPPLFEPPIPGSFTALTDSNVANLFPRNFDHTRPSHSYTSCSLGHRERHAPAAPATTAAPSRNNTYDDVIKMQDRTPGAWPTEEAGIDPAHRVSYARYKAAEDFETQVAIKESELLNLYTAIANSHDALDRSGREELARELRQREAQAVGLQQEIESLAKSMERMRTEGDEEYSKELAEEEKRGSRRW